VPDGSSPAPFFWSDLPKAQAVFCRRRRQPSQPRLASSRPGRPAPTIGPGTAAIVPSTPSWFIPTVKTCEKLAWALIRSKLPITEVTTAENELVVRAVEILNGTMAFCVKPARGPDVKILLPDATAVDVNAKPLLSKVEKLKASLGPNGLPCEKLSVISTKSKGGVPVVDAKSKEGSRDETGIGNKAFAIAHFPALQVRAMRECPPPFLNLRPHSTECYVMSPLAGGYPNAALAFLRRRHQARSPPLAKRRPGSPAPTMGAGTSWARSSPPGLFTVWIFK
jgi:hypothetical protein